MATMKEQIASARAYIKAKQYDEARRVLKRVDHPTAKEWLKKIDAIEPEPPMIGQFKQSDVRIIIGLIGVSMVLGILMAMFAYNTGVIGQKYGRDYESLNVFAFFTVLFSIFMLAAFQQWKADK